MGTSRSTSGMLSLKRFTWDNALDCLVDLSSQNPDEDLIVSSRKSMSSISKLNKRRTSFKSGRKLYFRETMGPNDKIEFKKYFQRKVSQDEPNVVTLEDVKNLIFYLVKQQILPEFANFLQSRGIDQVLRCLIVYFQRYLEMYEELLSKRETSMKKAPNPLTEGINESYLKELKILRYILAREYATIILGLTDEPIFHHIKSGKKTSFVSTAKSESEKDLKFYENFISVAHRIVWIALHRKHFSLIEIEINRLFRSSAYNLVARQSRGKLHIPSDILDVLQGEEPKVARRELSHSPLIHQLLYDECDFRILTLGLTDLYDSDSSMNCNARQLIKGLYAKEELFDKLKVKMGILGMNRDYFDLMLSPSEDKSDEVRNEIEKRNKYNEDGGDESSQTTVPRRSVLFTNDNHEIMHYPMQVTKLTFD